MSSQRSRDYLAARVETANSAQLHLMLIDGALRFGREAEKGVLRGDEVAYQPPLLRTLDVVGELLAGVRHAQTDLNAKLAQLYAFVYARLTSAYVNGDKTAMAEALQVLQVEQETWRLAVEKLASEGAQEADAAETPAPRKKAPAPKPHLGGGHTDAVAPTGLSLEA